MSRKGLMSVAGAQGTRLVLCTLSLVLLVAHATPAQIVYPRGDTDCSGQLSAVDLIAAVRGTGGTSVCGNDDCDRDGVVTPADLACAVGCFFGSCPTPPNAPRVTSVTAYSAPHIVPLSVVSVSVDNLGAAERLKRVNIGDSEARIVGPPSPDTLVVLVPDIAPGPADVVVYDGDLAGFPFPIAIVAPSAIGAPDTFDGSLDLLFQVLLGLGSLDLAAIYGEDADAVRETLASLRSALAIERARLASDPALTPAARAQLDTAFERSGLPEQLRQLLGAIGAVQPGGSAASNADGGAAGINPFALIAIASTLLAGMAGLAVSGPALAVAAAIASLLVNAATFLGLSATGVIAPPRIASAQFYDRDGNVSDKAVEGGRVEINGLHLSSTNLVVVTASRQVALAQVVSSDDFVQFRIPSGVYGICGSADFFLRNTITGAESNRIQALVLPELSPVLNGPGCLFIGEQQVFAVRGVTGCNAKARFRGDGTEATAETEYFMPGQIIVTMPAAVPGNYDVSIKVGSQETQAQPAPLCTHVTGVRASCDRTGLVVGPGDPPTANCTASPLPPGVKVPPELLTFSWSSSDEGTATVTRQATQDGQGHATVIAQAPGTTQITASLPMLKVTGDPVAIDVQDVTPPSVTLSAPDKADAGGSVSVNVEASDNVFVTRLVLHASGDTASGDQEFPCTQLEGTCTNSFTVGLMSMGQVMLTADAYDESGNKGTSNTVTVKITPPSDTMPPVVMITSPSKGGNVNAGETVQASVQATDNQQGDSGVQRVVIDVSGDALVSPAHLDTGTLPAPVPSTSQMVPFTVKNTADLANVTNKSIVITAQAFDAAGHTASDTSTVSVLGTLDMCDGGIQANPSSGHIGDAFTITVALTGPAAAHVARVISNNPGGQYDLQPQAGGVYTVTLFYQGQGSFALTFTALDADGHSLCSGSIGLTSLGSNG